MSITRRNNMLGIDGILGDSFAIGGKNGPRLVAAGGGIVARDAAGAPVPIGTIDENGVERDASGSIISRPTYGGGTSLGPLNPGDPPTGRLYFFWDEEPPHCFYVHFDEDGVMHIDAGEVLVMDEDGKMHWVPAPLQLGGSSDPDGGSVDPLDGVDTTVKGGAGIPGTNPGPAVGGDVRAIGGDAKRNASGDANGGNVVLRPGKGIGAAGKEGRIRIEMRDGVAVIVCYEKDGSIHIAGPAPTMTDPNNLIVGGDPTEINPELPADAVPGGSTTVRGQDGVAGVAAGAGAGGGANVTGGDAKRNTSGNADGGGVDLKGGAGTGTGTRGPVRSFNIDESFSRLDQGFIPQGYVCGLGMSNAADTVNDIAVAAGKARSEDDSFDLVLPAALTKRIDAVWAAGTAAGGLFSGSVAPDTWYHLHLIRNTTTFAVDVGFSTSITAADAPAGWANFKRVGSVLTNGSAGIVQFHQAGNTVYWKDPPLDVNDTSFDGTAETRQLQVPPGVGSIALVNAMITASGGVDNGIYISPMFVNDEIPSINAGPLMQVFAMQGTMASGSARVHVDTNRQVRTRCMAAGTAMRISTTGYIEIRCW